MSFVKNSPKRTAPKYSLRVAGWLLFSLVFLELFIRSFVIKSSTLASDAYWGAIPSEGSCFLHALEGFGVTCYESNNEVGTPFHDGLRIAVFGDSYTEAIQVDNSEKYVSLTEVALRERGFNVDLINLGDSNRTIADFIYLAPTINLKFAPEIVVLQTNEFGLFDTLNPNRRNYFGSQSGSLELIHRDIPETDLSFQNFIHYSGLLTLGAIKWEKATKSIISPDEEKEQPPQALPAQIRDEVTQFMNAYPNSRIVILVIPSVPIIPPNNTSLSWNNPKDQEILSTLAEIDNLTIVYPVAAFKELYKKHKIFPRGFFNSLPNYGHLNQYGHIAIATTLALDLEDLLK